MDQNLRGLFKRAGHNGAVAYEKEPGKPCFIIGSEGENLLVIEKPSRVVVPVVEYRTDAAVLDRLGALLWVSCGGSDLAKPVFPVVRSGIVVEQLRDLFKGRGLDLRALVIGSHVSAGDVWELEGSGVPLYGPVVLGDDAVILGVAAPEYVGEVAEVVYQVNGKGVWAAALSVLNPLGVLAVRVQNPYQAC
jgi:hypothetical protein